MPPELAPPGLPIRRIVIPAPTRTGETRALSATAASSGSARRMAAGILASALLCVAVRARRRRLAARLRRARAVAARARRAAARSPARCSAPGRCRSPSRRRCSPGSAARSAATRSSAPPPAWRCCSLAAPLFQPQFIAFALVRHVVGRRHGRALRALAGAAAWVATEWLVPRLLGDTLGYGLYPSRLLRQAADVGGAAGLTLALLLANEGVAAARRAPARRRRARWPCRWRSPRWCRCCWRATACAALSAAAAPAGKPLRMGLVQSNIVDYERLRREKGAGAVVREVLDTHYAMTLRRRRAAARRRGAVVGDGVPDDLRPPEERGRRRARPRDPRHRRRRRRAVRVRHLRSRRGRRVQRGRLRRARHRPARLLSQDARSSRSPSTCPRWLDGPTLRRWLPWAGTWQPGTGARVFPLRLADGREIPVLPLICLDDVDAGLADRRCPAGRAGHPDAVERLLVHRAPQGAQLHQAAAAFRSIETRLPQFRVTSNGYSAVIDATGSVIAGTRMGERTLVIGDVPVRRAAAHADGGLGRLGRARRPRCSSCCWRRRRRLRTWRAARRGRAPAAAGRAGPARRRRRAAARRPPRRRAAARLRARQPALDGRGDRCSATAPCRRTRWPRSAPSPRSSSRPRPRRGACCAPSRRAPRSSTACWC